MVSLRRIAALFRPHRATLALVVALILATSVVDAVVPFLIRAVIDVALPRGDLTLVALLAAGMVAAAVVAAVLGAVHTWLSLGVGLRVMHRLRTDLFDHLQRQSVAFFTRTRAGEVQSRLTNDIAGLQAVVTSTASTIVAQATMVITALATMVVLSWQLTVVSLVILPPAVLLARQVAAHRRTVTEHRQRELAEFTTAVEEGLSVNAIALTRTLGAGAQRSARFAASSRRLVDLERRSELSGRWRMALLSVGFAAMPALLYVGAGYAMTRGTLTVGTVIAFTAVQARLFQPVLGLLNVGITITSSRAMFGRVFEYLDLPVEIADPVRPVAIEPATVRGRLSFENVSVRYPDRTEPALHGVTLDVRPGLTVAVVGETGAGKSTLAQLVPRLLDPSTGRVTLDGIDLRDLRLADLAALVGVVSQETYLLHGTVRDNLRSARPSATDAEIEQAATAARVHDVISRLPDGYDTVVGARGQRFSGGERQRIAIARTLLRDPRVLVLDEATSALDPETERAVQAAFDTLCDGRTTIVVAHRLTAVRRADLIVVLDRGRIIEIGDHDSLVERGGWYARTIAADPVAV